MSTLLTIYLIGMFLFFIRNVYTISKLGNWGNLTLLDYSYIIPVHLLWFLFWPINLFERVLRWIITLYA